MEGPGVERQAERGEAGEAGAEVRLAASGGVRCAVRLLPMTSLASHAAEWRTPRKRPPPARMCSLQHRLDPVAEGEVGEAHDAGGDARPAVEAALAHGGHAGHELGLADRPHLLRPARAVHRVAFHEHRGHDVVAGADVVEKLVEQVAMVRTLPQVMVRVDDGQFGIEDGLGRLLGQPRLVRRIDPPELGRARGLGTEFSRLLRRGPDA